MLEKRSSCKALTCNCSFIVGNARKRRKFLRTSSGNSSNERGSIYIAVGPAPRNIPLPGVLLPGVLRMPDRVLSRARSPPERSHAKHTRWTLQLVFFAKVPLLQPKPPQSFITCLSRISQQTFLQGLNDHCCCKVFCKTQPKAMKKVTETPSRQMPPWNLDPR